MGCSKSNSKREVYSNTILPQETRKTQINNLNLHLKQLEKEEEEQQQKKHQSGTSLVAQWLRIRLPMQGIRVPSLVQEDPTGCGAAKAVRHKY